MSRGRILDTGYFPFYDDDFEESNNQRGENPNGIDTIQQSTNTDQNQDRPSDASNDQNYKTGVVILSLITVGLMLVCLCLVIINLNLKKSNEVLSNLGQCVVDKGAICRKCIGDGLSCYNCHRCGSNMESHKKCSEVPTRLKISDDAGPKCFNATLANGDITRGCGYNRVTAGCETQNLGNRTVTMCHCDTDYCNWGTNESNLITASLFGVPISLTAIFLNQR